MSYPDGKSREEYLKCPKLAILKQEKDLKVVRHLPIEEYSKIKTAIKEIKLFEEDQRPFKILCSNIDDLRKYILDLETNGVLKPGMERGLLDAVLTEINKLLLSLLTAFRTYNDHFETTYNRRYGKESEELASYVKYTHSVYDAYFAYRFFSNIRNFAQHCGLPITHFDLRSYYDEKKGQVINNSTVTFKRDEIIQKDKKMKSKFKEELSLQPEQLRVNDLLNEFEESIFTLNGNIIIFNLDKLIKNVVTLENYLQDVNLKNDEMLVIIKNQQHDGSEMRFKLEAFPYEIMHQIKCLHYEFKYGVGE